MSNFPSKLDTNAELVPVSNNITEIGAEAINAIREAIFAIQGNIGINAQGSTANIAARLAQVLNADGTFKSSALVAAGLIALPITDAMIGSTAAIKESKLDLDVSTQVLQNQITSSHITIFALMNSFNVLLSNFGNHTAGNFGRHDGYQIDVAGGIFTQPTINTVGLALDFIYTQFILHKDLHATGQHPASAITYAPNPNGILVGLNTVQDAISGIDQGYIDDRRKHNDLAHANGITADGYNLFSGQAAVNDAALQLSRYQPSAGTDLIKIGHINSAIIKSKGLNPIGLSASAQNINFTVKIGTATRTLVVTGLHTAAYPTINSRFTLKALVDYLNSKFADVTNHFPLQAYETDDGEIAIQHNIDRNDCTITVQDPGSQSAVSALGFSNIVGIEVGRVDNYFAYVDGYQYSSLRTIYDGTVTSLSSTSVLDLGVFVGQFGLFLHNNCLVHIYNHSNSNSNGTYVASSVGLFPSTQINLTTTVAAGTFRVVIYDDTADIGIGGNPRSVDVLYNKDQTITVDTRYQVTLTPIPGISIVEVSPYFNASSGTLTLNTSGQPYLQLTLNSQPGAQALFDLGFIGYLKVYASNNRDYITVFINSVSISTLSSSIAITPSVITDSQMLLGSTYFDSSTLVEIPIRKTDIGTTGFENLTTNARFNFISKPISDIISNGIVNGFDLSNTSTTITVSGGTAYVAGRQLIVSAQTFSVLNTATSDGTWNLVINKNTLFEVFNNSSAGYTISDLFKNRDYLLICQFTVTGGAIVSSTDGRAFINDLRFKVQPTVDTSDNNRAIFKTLDSAILHANNNGTALTNTIIISSIFTSTTALSVTTDTQVSALDDMTISSSLTLGQNAGLKGKGALTATSINLDDDAVLEVVGTLTATSIILNNNSKLLVHASANIDSITLSGEGATVSGLGHETAIVFSGNALPAININDGYSTITALNLSMSSSFNGSILSINDNASNIIIDECNFSLSGTVNSALWSTSRHGILFANAATINNIYISDCTFENFTSGITGASSSAVVSNLFIDGCTFNDLGKAIDLMFTANANITNNQISNVLTRYIELEVGGTNTATCISKNIFNSPFSGFTSNVIQGSTGVSNIQINDNLFNGISTVGDLVSCSPTTSTLIEITGNTFLNCTTDTASYIIDSAGLSPTCNIEDNIAFGHSGAVLNFNCNGSIVNNNFISTSVAGTPYQSISIVGTGVFTNGNTFKLTSDQFINLSKVIFNNNIVTAGYITLSASVAGDILIGNKITLSNSAIADAFAITYSNDSSAISIFNDNFISSNATTNAINISGNGSMVFSNNIVDSVSTSTNLLLLGSATSGVITSISDNVFKLSDTILANGLNVNRSNTTIIGNTFQCASGSPTNSSITIATLLTNIFINNNTLGNTAAAGARIINVLSALDVFVGQNKNASVNLQYSAVNAGTVNASNEFNSNDTWTYNPSVDSLISNSTSSYLIVPLLGLPVGSQLNSVTVHATAGTLSTLTIQLKSREISTGPNSTTLSSAATNGSTGTFQLSVSPNSTEYVKSTIEYFLVIHATAANVQVGNVNVNIFY